MFRFGWGFFDFFEEDFLTFLDLVFVLSSSESESEADSIALIIDLETVPRKAWLRAAINVICHSNNFLDFLDEDFQFF